MDGGPLSFQVAALVVLLQWGGSFRLEPPVLPAVPECRCVVELGPAPVLGGSLPLLLFGAAATFACGCCCGIGTACLLSGKDGRVPAVGTKAAKRLSLYDH